jgi:hypothetical protein
VPIEIALKVSEKILAGEEFATYITIPAFPEGGCCKGLGNYEQSTVWRSVLLTSK